MPVQFVGFWRTQHICLDSAFEKRVANVDDNSQTYNRPLQKIIKEMLAQLAIFLPLKEFFSI